MDQIRVLTQPGSRDPYPGPRPFESEEKDLFFGRDREVSDLVSLITAHPALLLYSQSGAGKTSLLKAGVLPQLREEFEVLPLARVRGAVPSVDPAQVPNIYVFGAILSWAGQQAEAAGLARVSLPEFLSRREFQKDGRGALLPRVAIFDQFEELFTAFPGRWTDRKGLFEQVNQALLEGLLARVVLSLREDYVARMEPYAPLLPEKLRTHFRLERLRGEAALAAIQEPLRGTSRSFADGVAEKLVQDLLEIRVEDTPGVAGAVTGEFAEPVQLQVVCQGLWRELPPAVSRIGPQELSAFGDVNRALSRFYERAVRKAVQAPGLAETALREWFEQHLITPAGTRGTVYRGPEQTGGIPNAALDVLESEHLVRAEWRAGARWYELVHDRFISPIRESNRSWGSEAQSEIERVRTLALKNQNDPEALQESAHALIAALAHMHAGVRRAAAEELARLPQSILDTQTVNGAVAALRAAEKYDPDDGVRQAASATLQVFGIAVGTARITLNVFDGRRHPFSFAPSLLIRILDGNQSQVYSGYQSGPSILFKGLPVYGDLRDHYTVLAAADGYRQAGYTPVRLSPAAAQTLDLMLLPKEGDFDFAEARWEALAQTHPEMHALLARGAPAQEAAQARYEQLLEQRPAVLAFLLNVLAAAEQTPLSGGNLLSYLRELAWDDTLGEMRCSVYADPALPGQLDAAVQADTFASLANPEIFRLGTTRAYRQRRAGEASLRVNLREGNTRVIGGIQCIGLELEFHYFRDPTNHALLELTGGATSPGRPVDPRTVYALRWMGCRRWGLPEFAPPYRIVGARTAAA